MLSPWVPILISAALGLVTVGANVVLVAFFLGKVREQQAGQSALFAAYQESQKALLSGFKEYLSETIRGLARRQEAFDDFSDKSRTTQAELNVRLGHIERNTDGMQALREDMIRLAARFDSAGGRTDDLLAAVGRDVTSLQRQVANLAAHGPGKIVELPNTSQG